MRSSPHPRLIGIPLNPMECDIFWWGISTFDTEVLFQRLALTAQLYVAGQGWIPIVGGPAPQDARLTVQLWPDPHNGGSVNSGRPVPTEPLLRMQSSAIPPVRSDDAFPEPRRRLYSPYCSRVC